MNRTTGFATIIAFWSALLLSMCAWTSAAQADTNDQVTTDLIKQDVYISNHFLDHHVAQRSDLNRLQSAVHEAANQGVTQKIALIWHFPSNIHSTAQAAHAIRQFLDLHGELIVVSPRGIGLSSDGNIASADMTRIAIHASPLCRVHQYVTCAIQAAQDAAAKVRANKDAGVRSAEIFWLVVLLILAAVIGLIVLFNVRQRKQREVRLDEMRQAASNTLSLADNAVAEIEAAGPTPPAEVRSEYDSALGLRERARAELQQAGTPEGLTQANQDAAQAVLALQGVMRRLDIDHPLTNPLDTGVRKCFYCGREDRPPYVTRSIDDGKGHSMQVDVCSVDAQRLQRGQTPQIQTAQYGSGMVPWWAVPTSPYYYSYGGPTWQYWLPFMIGMDVGGWYGGGWEGGYGYGGDLDGGYDQGYGDAGGQMPSDSGGVDAGSWGSDPGSSYGDSGGVDSGGWGGDSGGGGGGDSGGGSW